MPSDLEPRKAWMSDQVCVSVNVQTDEEKKTENNYDSSKTGDKKGWTVYKVSDTK